MKIQSLCSEEERVVPRAKDSADKFHDYDGLAGKMLLVKLPSFSTLVLKLSIS